MLEINGLLFEIEIIRKRMKNIYMRVNGNTISITCPKYVSDYEIYAFINERKKWIYDTYVKGIINESTSYKYHNGNIFYIFGKAYKFSFNIGRSKYEIKDDEIILTYKDYDKEKALQYLYKHLNKMLLIEGHKYIDKYIPMLLDYGYDKYPLLNAKLLKAKWGVCYTRNNKINISSYLIHYPLECLDYIILHEMTHLIVPNHSKRFYSIVKSYMPNYKEIQDSLK